LATPAISGVTGQRLENLQTKELTMEPEILETTETVATPEVETIETESAQISLSAIQLAEKLSKQVIAVTAKHNAFVSGAESKLAEALAEDAIQDEKQIAETVAARIQEVRDSIEAEFEAIQAQETAAESASVSQILNSLTEAGISL
jgi:hypothetical protein